MSEETAPAQGITEPGTESQQTTQDGGQQQLPIGIVPPQNQPPASAPQVSSTDEHWSKSAPEGIREMLANINTVEEFKAIGKPVVPESYTKPVGLDVEDSLFNSLGKQAKEAGFTQPQFEAALKMSSEQYQTYPDRIKAEVKAQMEADVKKLQGELGNEKFQSLLANAQKAFTKLGDEELKSFLEVSGLNNHPVLMKFFARAGEKLSEDSFITSGQKPTGAPRDTASAMFPSFKQGGS